MGIAGSRSRILLPSTAMMFVLAARSDNDDQAPETGESLTPCVKFELEKKRTPPEARTVNWLLVVDSTSASVESLQTNEPACAACARFPAAKEKSPSAALSFPPGMVEQYPEQEFEQPPLMVEKNP